MLSETTILASSLDPMGTSSSGILGIDNKRPESSVFAKLNFSCKASIDSFISFDLFLCSSIFSPFLASSPISLDISFFLFLRSSSSTCIAFLLSFKENK